MDKALYCIRKYKLSGTYLKQLKTPLGLGYNINCIDIYLINIVIFCEGTLLIFYGADSKIYLNIVSSFSTNMFPGTKFGCDVLN